MTVIVDCHTHLGLANGKERTPQELLASMDEAGIDSSVVIAEPSGGPLSQTDFLVSVAEREPRIKAIANVDVPRLDGAQVRRLTGLLDEGKVVGLKFYLGYEEYHAADERISPLYAACADRGKPVMFHTGALEKANKGLLKYSHPLTVDEVAHAFPPLRIILAHMGNPWLMDCAAVIAKNENVYAAMSAFFEEYQPITGRDMQVFAKRLEDVRLFLGSFERFLFGTDWPLYSQKEYLLAVQSLGLRGEEEDRVLWKNARELFGM